MNQKSKTEWNGKYLRVKIEQPGQSQKNTPAIYKLTLEEPNYNNIQQVIIDVQRSGKTQKRNRLTAYVIPPLMLQKVLISSARVQNQQFDSPVLDYL